MVQPQLDQLAAWAASTLPDLVLAKEEYFAHTGGEVHEDDRCFEQRMQAFINWYLLDRARGNPPQTPVQQFLQEKGPELPGHDKRIVMGFMQSRLSLYEYRGKRGLLRRVKKGQVRVREAFTGEDFDVTERRHMHGLEVGDLFEARLVPYDGSFHFSTSFTYHPREVKPAILREIKRRKKAKGGIDARAFVWELERMALQAERFRNVPIHAIYNFEAPFLGGRTRKAEAAAGS